MANITIRDIPDKTKEILRVQAVCSSVSLEAYVRYILQKASSVEGQKFDDILSLAEKYFGSKSGVELDLPKRKTRRKIPDFNNGYYGYKCYF